MKTAYNHLTHSYETPDKTTVAAEICEGDSPSDAFRAAAIREQQRKSAAYVRTVIEALYENSDPVSVEAAELLERMTQPEPEPEPVIDKSAAVRIATSLGWEPKRKPLTDEEIVKITADPCLYIRGGDYRIDIARAIEAAHGIKE